MRIAVAVFSVALCAAQPSLAQEATPDPWEGFNRDMYAVHEALDRNLLEPVARGYRAATPRSVRTGVSQFLRNLRGPVIFANDVLQGQPQRAGVTAARFGINTTVGVLGVFDPAASMGLERHDEDFGQTLGVWGVGAGPYIFVPLMGPTNLRDATGRVVDVVFDPLTWAEFDDVESVRAGRAVLDGIAVRESIIETIDDVRLNSLDPYATIRTSYGLLRESAIQNGQTDVQDLPDFDENLDMPSDSGVEGNPQQSPQSPTAQHRSDLEEAAVAPISSVETGVSK